ncbi:Conidiation protein 6-domain-containing protein [Fomitopsis betulina]|nr:Conidiation protein 6-domain-containing protein [Fomitopsis betulina]
MYIYTSFCAVTVQRFHTQPILLHIVTTVLFARMTAQDKHTTRVAAGLKASIHNLNVSEEARERAADRLESIEAQGDEHDNRQLGGYKATLHNENTSSQAKKHAREVLEAAGYTVEPGPGLSHSEHQIRVLAGYKAALHNPRVSEEAKEHAREYLQEHGAL